MLLFIKLSRPYNVLLPLVAIFAGYTIAWGQTKAELVVTMILFAILHGVVTIWNDIEDEAGDKLNGITRMAQVRRAGHRLHYIQGLVFLTTASLVVGFWLLPLGSELLLLGYIGLGWLYNSPPARLCAQPISSMLVMWLGYGVIPFALGANLGYWSWQVMLFGLAWATGRLTLSLLKDYKDAPGDAQATKKTFLLVYGHRRTAQLSFGLLLVSLVIILTIVAQNHKWLRLLALAAVATGLLVERWQLFRHDNYRSLHAIFRDGLRYQLIFDVAVVVWLRIS